MTGEIVLSIVIGLGMLVNALLMFTVIGAMRFMGDNLSALWIVQKTVFAETNYVANYLREIEKQDGVQPQKETPRRIAS